MPINVFQTARGEGKLHTMVTQWDNAGGTPDIDTTAEFYYPPSSRNYIGDPQLAQMTDEAARELDPKKREADYAKLFDKVTDERYMMPLVEFPAIMVLSKDIVVDSNHLKPEGFVFNRLSWSK
jgi:ABC-type transport system substrate-binding protein